MNRLQTGTPHRSPTWVVCLLNAPPLTNRCTCGTPRWSKICLGCLLDAPPLTNRCHIGTLRSVTNMSYMFARCTLFNQPLPTWNTSSVTDMGCMFLKCTSFHQPLGNWHAPLSVFARCPDPKYCSTAYPEYYDVK